MRKQIAFHFYFLQKCASLCDCAYLLFQLLLQGFWRGMVMACYSYWDYSGYLVCKRPCERSSEGEDQIQGHWGQNLWLLGLQDKIKVAS